MQYQLILKYNFIILSSILGAPNMKLLNFVVFYQAYILGIQVIRMYLKSSAPQKEYLMVDLCLRNKVAFCNQKNAMDSLLHSESSQDRHPI